MCMVPTVKGNLHPHAVPCSLSRRPCHGKCSITMQRWYLLQKKCCISCFLRSIGLACRHVPSACNAWRESFLHATIMYRTMLYTLAGKDCLCRLRVQMGVTNTHWARSITRLSDLRPTMTSMQQLLPRRKLKLRSTGGSI